MTKVTKVCAETGCYRLLPLGVDRCDQHRLEKRRAQHRNASAAVMAKATVCAICGGRPTAKDPLTADHIWPVAHGGLSVPENYQAAHRSCNSRKGAKI